MKLGPEMCCLLQVTDEGLEPTVQTQEPEESAWALLHWPPGPKWQSG